MLMSAHLTAQSMLMWQVATGCLIHLLARIVLLILIILNIVVFYHIAILTFYKSFMKTVVKSQILL